MIMGRFVAGGLALLVVFLASAAHGAPIDAVVVHLEGDAFVISSVKGGRVSLTMGDHVYEGDRISALAGASVEIKFDTGSVIKIGEKTDMVVKSLRRNDSGSTFSIFGLLAGRVKSAVGKLFGGDSKFEYHTKAAVAGVAGTPPFVVEFDPVGNRMGVDLLGKQGQSGAVFVQGFDPAATLINLGPGARTFITPGAPPAPPSPISSQRFRRLNQGMPFVSNPTLNKATTGETTTDSALKQGAPLVEPEPEEKKEEPKPEEKGEEPPVEEPQAGEPPVEEPKAEEPKAGSGVQGGDATLEENLVINNIQRKISKPRQVAPDQVNTTEALENVGTKEQGIIEQNSQGTGDNAPPPSTVTVDIRINLK